MPERTSFKGAGDYILRVAWAAHSGAGEETKTEAEEVMNGMLPMDAFVLVEERPDLILFMSGGSERRAIELSDPDRPILLLSIRGNNAYAAATEVQAWMVNNSRIAILSDAEDAAESGLLDRWRRVVAAWSVLIDSRAGLIGTVSEWLVASNVPAAILMQKFRISLVEIPWSSMPDYQEEAPDKALMERFSGLNPSGLREAAQVLTLLRRLTEERDLDAIAVECFSLVQQRKVTACLALAQMNTEGTPAACEGDLASLAGMMLIRAIAGLVPWMANTTRITEKSLILSHCTIAFDLVNDIKLPTHFETDSSLALDGQIRASEVTLFRFSDMLDRAFIAEGRVVSRPGMSNACRTQVEIGLNEEEMRILRERPLGNHLLMMPGKHSELLHLVCRYKGIRVVE